MNSLNNHFELKVIKSITVKRGIKRDITNVSLFQKSNTYETFK